MDSNDAEANKRGIVAIGRERRGRRKFASLLIIHTLLTGMCVFLCFFTRDSSQKTFQDKGIYLNMIPASGQGDVGLLFTVSWNHDMELRNKSEVMVKHGGPYVFYICAVVQGTDGGVGNLTLNQRGIEMSITLQPTMDTCRRHERLVSLYEKEVVTFRFEKAHTDLTLIDLRVGLHYMLGEVTMETPEKLPNDTQESVTDK